MAILEALDRMTPVSGSSTVVSPENFIKCLKKFYSHWKEDVYGLWGSPGAIAVATPPYSDDIRYRKSLALSMWFFGRDFADTIMVFLSSQIHFLSGQDGCDLLEHLKMPVSKAVGLDIVLHNIEKAGNGSLLMDQILNSVCAQYESNGVVMGHIAREKPEGKVLEEWYQKLHGSRFILPAEHYSSYQPNRPEDDGGESWDEMERKARDADAEMGSESDSEDERQRRREKAKAKSRHPSEPSSKGAP